YPGSAVEQGDTSFSKLCLDARYDGLAVGQQLLVDDTHGAKHLVTITEIDQVTDSLGSAADTVTRLTVEPAIFPPPPGPPEIFLGAGILKTLLSVETGRLSGIGVLEAAPSPQLDRRNMIVHQLTGPAIKFWDSAYPQILTTPTIYLPGFKIADDSGGGIEVGRTVEKDHFKPGVILRTSDLQPGREVLL